MDESSILHTHESNAADTRGSWYARACNHRLLNEHDREFADLSDTIRSPDYRQPAPGLTRSFEIFFFYFPTQRRTWGDEPSKREATPLPRPQPGRACSYGTGAPAVFPTGKSAAIFHCPTRQCICLLHTPSTHSIYSTPYPLRRHRRKSVPPPCAATSALTAAWAHFVGRDNVFIIHRIIRRVAGNQVGRLYATPTATSNRDILARLYREKVPGTTRLSDHAIK